MRIKNWEKFQHFKDRTPPWVKLYRDILDDPDWHSLDGESAKVLTMLWLVASEDKDMAGNLPDIRRLAFRLRMDEKDLLRAVSKLSHWIEEPIQGDITTISPRYQPDAPKRAGEETETETETETPAKPARFNFLKALTDNSVDPVVAMDYIATRKAKKCVQTETAFRLLVAESGKAELSLADAVAICCKRGWGGFEAAWIKPEDKPQPAKHAYVMPEFMRGAI